MTKSQYDRKLESLNNKIEETEEKLIALKFTRKELKLLNPNRRNRSKETEAPSFYETLSGN